MKFRVYPVQTSPPLPRAVIMLSRPAGVWSKLLKWQGEIRPPARLCGGSKMVIANSFKRPTKYSARFPRLRGIVEQSPATLLEDEAVLDIDGSTTGILPWSLFDSKGIVFPPTPSTVQFHDRIALSGELYRCRRGEMTDL